MAWANASPLVPPVTEPTLQRVARALVDDHRVSAHTLPLIPEFTNLKVGDRDANAEEQCLAKLLLRAASAHAAPSAVPRARHVATIAPITPTTGMIATGKATRNGWT